jgi:uncharacterized protein (DUF1697 family)
MGTVAAETAMPQYIAFLGGINLGKRRVKMDHLASIFEALGFKDVKTFIASGNVIFETRSADAASLERKIEAHLEKSFGYEVLTFLRTRAEVAATVIQSPFLDDPGTDGCSYYVGFLKQPLGEAAAQRVVSLGTENDTFRVQGRQMFWRVAGKLTGSLVKSNVLNRAIGTPCTLRNITTVRKLAALYPTAKPR